MGENLNHDQSKQRALKFEISIELFKSSQLMENGSKFLKERNSLNLD